jgi:hypothetical protein
VVLCKRAILHGDAERCSMEDMCEPLEMLKRHIAECELVRDLATERR